MSKKKIILIVLVSLIAFSGGYLVIKYEYQPRDNNQTGSILNRFGDSKEQTNTGKSDQPHGLSLLTEKKATSLSNSMTSSEAIYYEKNTGRVFKVDLENKEEVVLSDKIIPNFIGALWSPNKKDSIQFIYSPEGTKFRYFNIITGEEKDLSEDIKSISFSPTGEYVGFYVLGSDIKSQEEGKIYISQPNGEYQKSIFKTRITDLSLSWPLKDKLQIITESEGIFLLSEGGRFEKFIESTVGFDSVWSRSGKKMLFSAFDEGDGFKYNSFIVDTASRETIKIETETLASRCIWSIDDVNLYCVVAKSSSEDEIYKIDTLAKTRKLVAEPGMTIGEMIISNLEDRVIFTNAADSKLYSLDIDN